MSTGQAGRSGSGTGEMAGIASGGGAGAPDRLMSHGNTGIRSTRIIVVHQTR
jgi:hypothetical protein